MRAAWTQCCKTLGVKLLCYVVAVRPNPLDGEVTAARCTCPGITLAQHTASKPCFGAKASSYLHAV